MHDSAMPRFIPLASLGLLVVSVSCNPPPDSALARQRKMDGLLEKFDRFDYNGDGYLTRRELDNGARQLGIVLSRADLDRIMTGYDLNRDRRISHWEAEKAAATGPTVLESR